jgi:LPXTG-motif cell wall-anchored protein
MQFGKTHGIALAVLGVILLAIQAMFYIPSGQVPTDATGSSSSLMVEHKTNSVVGILGIASLLAGAAIFSTRRRRRTRSETRRQVGANILAFHRFP